MLSMLFAGFVCQSAALDFFDDVDDHLNLLQVQATQDNRAAFRPHSCNDFAASREMTLAPPADVDVCRCFGDTHCNAVPFDVDVGTRVEAILSKGHYQYDGPGVSRYAKAADGSWEVQIFQCGMTPSAVRFHPSGQVGVVIKADGIVVEVGTGGRPAPSNTVKCFVNGEEKPAGHEVHLPTGFHFQCPKALRSWEYGRQPLAILGTFCAKKDGQFVVETKNWMSGNQVTQNLWVPKTVQVQKENTVCYDPASKHFDETSASHEIANTAIVSAEDVLFSQALIDHMSQGSCQLQEPPQSAVPEGEPSDPKTVCDMRDPGAWQHAQEVCSPLQEEHPGFYQDCLLDDCVTGDDSEEEMIEEMAEEEERQEMAQKEDTDGASAVGDPHITSSKGKYDLDHSMLKHHKHRK